MVSSTKRNGILLIAVSVVFAVAIILAVTLTKGSKQSSERPKRYGKFVDSKRHFDGLPFLLMSRAETNHY